MDQDAAAASPVPGQTPGQAAEHALAERAARTPVSNDEIAKIRLWHLLAQAQQIFRQTIFADTKAATLLALVGLIAARVAVSIPEGGFNAFVAVVFVNKAIVLSVCLLVIMPRYPRPEIRDALTSREQFSWASLANPIGEPFDYGAVGAGAEADEICRSVARANQDAAFVLQRKFRVLRIAFLFAIADVFLTIGVYIQHSLGW